LSAGVELRALLTPAQMLDDCAASGQRPFTQESPVRIRLGVLARMPVETAFRAIWGFE
jgi:hypothetical protein